MLKSYQPTLPQLKSTEEKGWSKAITLGKKTFLETLHF